MALPYERKFNVGRGSEQLYNEELHMLYEIIKHLPDDVTDPDRVLEPTAKMSGSLWHDYDQHDLKWYDIVNGKWRLFFENRFKIFSEMLSVLPPEDPIKGQLWLHQGVLCYYDGVTWQPMQALPKEASQFSLDVFRNFLIVSPLWKIGNTVVPDEEVVAYRNALRQYLQGILDANIDSAVIGDGTKWTFEHVCNLINPLIPTFDDNTYCQLLVPHIDYARMFLDHELDTEKYIRDSAVCIRYKKNDLLGVTPSLVHLNPGRLSKIKKTLIKVNRANPKIMVPAGDTEYYGFHVGEWGGDLLIPDEDDNNLKDYTIIPDGILLSYNASQNYDYVLAVHYEFSWIKSSGTYSHVTASDSAQSYYINGYNGPMNVFVEGYDIEEPYFTSDAMSGTISFKENVTDMEISMMHSPWREYGYIRVIDIFNRGIIYPLKKYHTPLIFVNGEAVSVALDQIEPDAENQRYMVPGATVDMAWSIVELYDEEKDFNAFYSEGYVDQQDSGNTAYIQYDINDIPDTDTVVLFIDGLLVKKEDIEFDRINGRIYTPGLTLGQEYIVLHDKYSWLYNEETLFPAFAANKVSESLVYLNNKLLCNESAIDIVLDETDAHGVHNEVKCFKKIIYDPNAANPADQTQVIRSYKIYDEQNKQWIALEPNDIHDLLTFGYGYENTRRSVKLLLPYTTEDKIDVYAFGTASDVNNPLIIKNIDVNLDPNVDPGLTEILTEGAWTPGQNELRVWVNGVRIYPETGIVHGIKEKPDGSGFYLPEPIWRGRVTYVIEQSETPITAEVLGPSNITPGTVNIYKTSQPLYPGRVTVYINGIRQPQETYMIQDNYTLIFPGQRLVGNYQDYPSETWVDGENIHVMQHPVPDYILVEVRNDNRVEKTFKILQDLPAYELSVDTYHIDREILETSDEVMIFVDGLYFGAKMQDGYSLNLARGTITISQPEILSSMNHDEQFMLLATDSNEHLNYLEKYGSEYAQYRVSLTLEYLN